MLNRGTYTGLMVAAVLVAAAMVFTVTSTEVSGQNYSAEQTAFGEADFNGIWQAIGAHHWNIEPHAASQGPVVELGAIGSIPGGLGIVEGGEIPYTAAARATQQENNQHRIERDPR
jgi:hypothetical protein